MVRDAPTQPRQPHNLTNRFGRDNYTHASYLGTFDEPDDLKSFAWELLRYMLFDSLRYCFPHPSSSFNFFCSFLETGVPYEQRYARLLNWVTHQLPFINVHLRLLCPSNQCIHFSYSTVTKAFS